ncbi:MAG: transglycosylase SLT domain-containing protein [bacterium]
MVLRHLWPWLALMLLPALALAAAHKHVKHDYWSNDYDRYFRKYTKHYFGPHVDWHWFKAQAIAESGLRPNVRSSAGAKGIMQILPSTYEEIKLSNPHIAGIEDPKWNIAAGIYYDRQLYRRWRNNKIPSDQRLSFTFASYNAGYGAVNKAFRRARKKHEDVKSWTQVAPFSPRETRHYVKRIDRLMKVDG